MIENLEKRKKSLGTQLFLYRKQLKFTRQRVAEGTGLSPGVILSLENDNNLDPNPRHIIKLSEFYGKYFETHYRLYATFMSLAGYEIPELDTLKGNYIYINGMLKPIENLGTKWTEAIEEIIAPYTVSEPARVNVNGLAPALKYCCDEAKPRLIGRQALVGGIHHKDCIDNLSKSQSPSIVRLYDLSSLYGINDEHQRLIYYMFSVHCGYIPKQESCLDFYTNWYIKEGQLVYLGAIDEKIADKIMSELEEKLKEAKRFTTAEQHHLTEDLLMRELYRPHYSIMRKLNIIKPLSAEQREAYFKMLQRRQEMKKNEMMMREARKASKAKASSRRIRTSDNKTKTNMPAKSQILQRTGIPVKNDNLLEKNLDIVGDRDKLNDSKGIDKEISF